MVGPLTAFGPPYPAALPAAALDAVLTIAPEGAPRNGMPSLHAIWALLLWFNAWPMSVGWRRALRFFAMLNIWAAMGLDDTHWIMDLVVGVPLAVAIQCVAVTSRDAKGSWWIADAALCAAIGGVWLWGFRGGWLLGLSPMLAWGATVATVVFPLYLQRRAAARTAQAQRGSVLARDWYSPSTAAPAVR